MTVFLWGSAVFLCYKNTLLAGFREGQRTRGCPSVSVFSGLCILKEAAATCVSVCESPPSICTFCIWVMPCVCVLTYGMCTYYNMTSLCGGGTEQASCMDLSSLLLSTWPLCSILAPADPGSAHQLSKNRRTRSLQVLCRLTHNHQTRFIKMCLFSLLHPL